MRYGLLCAALMAGEILAPHAFVRGTTAAAADWKLVVLGVAQDGGIPHLGCTKPPCADIRAGVRPAEKVASIGVVDRRTAQAYVFDATPDFPAQLHAINGGAPPAGIFLTHAHIGHYTGLMYLGKESIAAREVPVYGTPRMAAYLRDNGPWSLLLRDRHIALRTLQPDEPLDLPGGLRVTAFLVPHRDEFTDTVGYRIQGPRATALYVPDTDRWETWTRSIRELADAADLALLDGTFASAAEVQDRDITQIPHPLTSATRALLRGAKARLWFIHLNHTNPELGVASDVVREGMEFDL